MNISDVHVVARTQSGSTDTIPPVSGDTYAKNVDALLLKTHGREANRVV